jgi:HPt (histidine-containing phosphotransfer) domain-containing protein
LNNRLEQSIIQMGDLLELKPPKILINVPPGLPRILVAEYLERSRSSLALLEAAVCQNQHEQTRILGHRMKGTGSPSGFSRLPEIGDLIEQASADQNSSALREHIAELAEYLSRVEIAGD